TRLLAQAQEETNKHNKLIITPKKGNNNNWAIDQEIECPRCHDIMTLCSDFDKLCYVYFPPFSKLIPVYLLFLCAFGQNIGSIKYRMLIAFFTKTSDTLRLTLYHIINGISAI
ncbi:MAG: hypothetical protein WCC17_23065, partial [Candidatus Nitrosopolaris sp.]